MPLDCANYIDPLTETEQVARTDLFRWLGRFPERVPALLEAVREGRMDGISYRGRCRCVIGTLVNPTAGGDNAIAAFRNAGLAFFTAVEIEAFVREIQPGDTPANSPVMAHLERWIMEWLG